MPREFRRYGLELGARLWRAEIVKRQARLDLERAAEVRAAKRRARAHAPLNERQAAFVRAYVLTGNGDVLDIAQIVDATKLRKAHVKDALTTLINAGKTIRSGAGKRGNPFKYQATWPKPFEQKLTYENQRHNPYSKRCSRGILNWEQQQKVWAPP